MKNISVIVCNQKGKYLDLCLHSIAWQQDIEFETIVVDYGMDPPFEGTDDVKVIRWEADEWNHAQARNIGIANASGDLLCLTNSDCVMHPELLVTARVLFRSGTHQYWYRWDVTREATKAFDLETAFKSPPQCRLGQKGNCGDFMLVERDAVIEIGGYDERCAGWGYYDTDLANRLGQDKERWYGAIMPHLLHLWHPPRRQMDEWHRNRENCVGSGVVRNDGPETFERYRL